MRSFLPAIGLFLLFLSCKEQPGNSNTLAHSIYRDSSIKSYGPYVALKLPLNKGVSISNPIQISRGPGDRMYAANQTGEVYSLHDTNGDGLEDSTALYCNVGDFGLRSPAGIAFKGDTIFISTAQQIRAFLDSDKDGKADKSWAILETIPESGHPYEWTSGLTLGPDGWLYCALATDSWNAAPSPDAEGLRGSILRLTTDGKVVERLATGVRSVYGIGFNKKGDMFFTDNEGGGNPGEELNLFVKDGFYGHNPAKFPHDSILGPTYALQMEVAPSGLAFNSDSNDFGGSAGNLFVGYYGPGERWDRGAVSRIQLETDASGKYSYSEIPVVEIPKVSDIEFGYDGNLYVVQHGMADYWYNVVYQDQGNFYKVMYEPTFKDYKSVREPPKMDFSEVQLEAGKQLFAEAACLGCHQVGGDKELLGPNLQEVGKQLSRDEILEEITAPSARIKPSMMGQQIELMDGHTYLGRLVSSNENELSVMLVGNSVVNVPRDKIKTIRDAEKSLMYEGLLTGMSETQVNALLDYVISLSQ